MGFNRDWNEKENKKANWLKLKDKEEEDFVIVNEDDIVNFVAHYFNNKTWQCVADEGYCELCNAGVKAQHNSMLNIFSLKDMSNKVWSFRKTVKESLKKIREKNDGTFDGLVLTLSKEGEKEKTKWTVVNSNLKKAKAAEIKELFKPVDLEELVPPKFAGKLEESATPSTTPTETLDTSGAEKMLQDFMADDTESPF